MKPLISIAERSTTATLVNGRIRTCDVVDCQSRWNSAAGDLVSSEPVLADGQVSAGTTIEPEDLAQKAARLRDMLLDLGEGLRITDLQLGLRDVAVAISPGQQDERSFANREFIFEVEVQRTIGRSNLLGSSYLYTPTLDGIDPSDILTTVTFPLRSEGYTSPPAAPRTDVVFGPPVMASLLENLVYSELMEQPQLVPDATVSVCDRPQMPGSVAVHPVDDTGCPTRDVTLYGPGPVSAVESRYFVPARSFQRKLFSDLTKHPTNIVITGPQADSSRLLTEIERGIYIHLIVGSHNCQGNVIEGTVFNSFAIDNGILGRALRPFHIKINKQDLLPSIRALGTDIRMLRPFPWWSPVVIHTPTVFCRGLRINHPFENGKENK